MSSQLEQVRNQQRQAWAQILFRVEKIGHALRDTSNVLDVAAGTGEPGLTSARLAPNGMVTATDLSDRMLEVAAENAAGRGIHNFRPSNAMPMPFRFPITRSMACCAASASCSFLILISVRRNLPA
jgi:ubiquinone/menaquinone biosynthesis C-methylase UbiE